LVTDAVQVIELGRSVEGRPITAVERGTPGGAVVLVIGVIHGDEQAGVAILEELATAELPVGVDLWLVETMNPDGQAANRRTNANLVDLNRNFPYNWAPLGQPGDPEYGGTAPASEPETQAIVDLISRLEPELGIWYHQDLYRIAPGDGRDGELRSRYAELTGLPVLSISGGTYTGVAATWQRNTVEDGVAFIVELGPELSADEAATHAAAVLDLATVVAED
jgi:protein MpaA